MLDPLSVSIPLSAPRAEPDSTAPVRKLLKPSPEHPDDYVMELDYSTISSFLECQRKFENYAIRSREAARDGSAVAFGGLFHKLEETRLRSGGLQPDVIASQHDQIERHFVASPPPAGDHRTGDRMVQVLKQYNERYSNDGIPSKVFADSDGTFVERPFKIELSTVEVNAELPYGYGQLVHDGGQGLGAAIQPTSFFVRNLHILYTGRIDAVLEEPPLLWVLDHKTSSRGGREFEEAFRLSLQTRGYCWATQKITGKTIAGLIMNAVIIRPLTKTGTGTEFNRHTYFYSQDSLHEWEECMRDIVSDIVASLLRGRFPQYARSFKSPCSGCDYSENCPLPREQRATDLASELYRDVRWNPMH